MAVDDRPPASPQARARAEASSPGGRSATTPSSTQRRADLATRYHAAHDLRAFIERSRPHLDDPETAYFVSQAYEECHVLAADLDGSPFDRPSATLHDWARQAAALALVGPCLGFSGRSIDPREVLELLTHAASAGDPRARARLLLLRDIAAPKSEVMAQIPPLLATRNPIVVRDVGAFLSKGELVWRYGAEPVPAPVAAIAWELAACDLGYPCGPASRLVLGQCAFRGTCDAYGYEEALARIEAPDRFEAAARLREGLVLALTREDWEWLGLGTAEER